MIKNYNNIAITADESFRAQNAKEELVEKYNFSEDINSDNIDLLVVLGGDGFMLHSLHNHLRHPIPVYGMNCGTVGFLLNDYYSDDLMERISNAKPTYIKPLEMKATTIDNKTYTAIAINEVSLLRQTSQAAHINIMIDDVKRVNEMVCDGVLLATPAGSTAYNYSIGGPVIPIRSNILALTPISPFRPRRWKGALLPDNAQIKFDIVDYEKRSVSAVADFREIRNVKSVSINEKPNHKLTLLFDEGHALEERIISEQFRF